MNDVQRRQLEETMNRERRSKSSWAMQHAEEEAGRITAYKLDDMKHQRLHNLREQVADWPIVWSRAAAYGRISRLVHGVLSPVSPAGALFTRARRSHTYTHTYAPPHPFAGG